MVLPKLNSVLQLSMQSSALPKDKLKMNVSLSTQGKLSLITGLSTLIASGIPILEAVDSLMEESKENTKKILLQLKEDLNQGKTISESFARFPRSFDPATVNLIKAAEEAGTLDTSLKDLIQSIKKDAEFMGQVRSALAYPILVVIVLVAVLGLNLFFVIPRVADVFARLKIPTPLPTRILLTTSKIITTYTIPTIVTGAFGSILIFFGVRANSKFFINLISALPIIDKLILEIDLTRFTRSMALLLKSGIPITDALEFSQDVVFKGEFRNLIGEAVKAVSSGKKLSEGLKKTKKLIPNFMLRIIEAAESNGTLEKSMQDLSEQFNDRVSTRIKTLTTLIEPLLLIIVGRMVGGIMLSIIAPIYNLIGNIRGR